jgi:thiamine-monophosphate kinase
VNELELIARLLPHLAPSGGDLVVGAGEDDAAVWRTRGDSFTVASCDTSVESVHFDLDRQAPEDVGWRALCFALGDLAAKGARPTFGLVSIAIPRSWPVTTTEGIYRGIAGLAAETGLRLAGGDTTATPGPGSLTITVLGAAAVEPKPRSAAQPGWRVGVTGPLGGAKLEWSRPRPRLEVGERLAVAGLCSGDISDGLVRELDKFAAAAGVGAVVRLDAVPRAEGVAPLEAIASGEEVELVTCGPAPLPPWVHEVGELTAGGRVVVVGPDGRPIRVEERGYDHFG